MNKIIIMVVLVILLVTVGSSVSSYFMSVDIKENSQREIELEKQRSIQIKNCSEIKDKIVITYCLEKINWGGNINK